jgi:serine/threonine protein kinase
VVQDAINEEAVMREVELWASLGDHPNIIKYIGHIEEYKEDHKEVIILWEYWSGGTLIDLLQKYNLELAEEQIIYVMKNLWNGLKHMHSQDPPITHRDIKMENILMEDEQFKLGDFGSCSTDTLDYNSKNKNEISEKMEIFEKYTTMMYRPPEMIDQYKRHQVNTKVDIWMLGCVLYTLWFAKHPFQDAQKLAITNGKYVMPNKDHKRISKKLRDLIRVMLIPDPSERPDISKIIEILDNWDKFKWKESSEKKFDHDLHMKHSQSKDSIHHDLLGFESSPKEHKSISHSNSMNAQKLSHPSSTGWAAFDMNILGNFKNTPKEAESKNEENWFDYVGNVGFDQKEPQEVNKKEPEDQTWSYFDFS